MPSSKSGPEKCSNSADDRLVKELENLQGLVAELDALHRRVEELEDLHADRQRAEAALRESETRYRDLFEQSPISIWEEDWSAVKAMIDGLASQNVKDWSKHFRGHSDQLAAAADLVKIIGVNQATLDIYRTPSVEALREFARSDNLTPDDIEAFLQQLIAFIAGTTFATDLKERAWDGAEIVTRIRASIPSEHRQTWSRVVTIVADITEHTRAEQLNTRLGRIIEDAANEIYVFGSEDLRFIQVNRGARENLGYTMDELRQLTPLDLKLQFTEDDFAELIGPLREGSQAQIVFATAHRRKDGSTYDVEVRLQLSRAETPPAFVAIIQDITERKEAEEKVLAAKEQAEFANRAKSEFLANMSHELRTPLNAIIGFSEMIRGETFGPIGSPKYLEYVEDINESGTHLLALINDILDLSKIEAGKTEVHEESIEIPATVQSCLALVEERADAAGVDLEVDVPRDSPALYADKRKLKQILVNLLSNAIKFTPSGGKVSLKMSCSGHDGCDFQIADTGIGIAHDDIPKALASFQQIDSDLNRRYAGTGLGLPLTKALVELHGGSLDLESEVGVGTTVTVHFPAGRILPRTAAAERA